MSEKPTYEELEKRIWQIQKTESELRHTEDTLRESEERYRSLIDFSPLPFLVTQEEKITFVNPAGLNLFGVKNESEIIGTSPNEWIHPDFMDLAYQRRCQVLENGGMADPKELTLIMKNGRQITVIANTVRIAHHGLLATLSVFQDITERELIQKKLIESENLFRGMFDNHSAVMLLIDPHTGFIIKANQAAVQYYGYPLEKMLEMKINQLNVLSSIDITGQMQCALNKQINVFEFRHLLADGQVRDVEVHSSPITIQHQTVLFSIISDITERKQAEAALEKHLVALTQPLDSGEGIEFEDLFNPVEIQRLQDNFSQATRVASIITRPDGKPITAPSNFCRLCSDIIRKTEKGFANCCKSDAILGRQKPEGPTVQLCLSGGLWDSGAAITVGGRHVANWLVGQVRNEEQTEEKMRAYAREIDADEEAVAEAFNEVPAMSRDQFEKVACALYALTNQLSTIAYQKVQQARFISDQKRSEEQREKLQAQLNQAQKMESIGTLAGGIAHDFNNILFPIIGHAEILMDDVPGDSPVQDSLKEIYASAMRARGLVQQILSFAHQEKNELRMMRMQPIIKEALRLIRATIPTTITMAQNIQPDCGTVKADPTQIHQIVMNLATNAWHAMAETGGELSVSLKQIELSTYDFITPDMSPGLYNCMTVADTGTGMTPEVMSKIFDPFFTTKEKGKGTGMGLSVVHGIVKNMNGEIQVHSEPGKGTEFNIFLPVVRNSSEDRKLKTDDPMHGGCEKLLLVDDETVIIAMEKQILERLGYQVTSRTSSMEAIEVFRSNPDQFDLVITDMAMPKMSGDRLAAELIRIRPDIPILLCTGFSENLTDYKIKSLGIRGLLMKPIVTRDLAKKIREVFDDIKI